MWSNLGIEPEAKSWFLLRPNANRSARPLPSSVRVGLIGKKHRLYGTDDLSEVFVVLRGLLGIVAISEFKRQKRQPEPLVLAVIPKLV